MKTKERTVYFYELILTSVPRLGGVSSSSCADLSLLLKAIFETISNGVVIRQNATESVELVKAKVFKKGGSDIFAFLVNRADSDVSDIALRNMSTRSVRMAGKQKIEAIELSSHIILKPNDDQRSALVMMTMGAGFSGGVVKIILERAIKSVSINPKYHALFNFPMPSGEVDADGNVLTYPVRYRFEIASHRSAFLDEALETGTFKSMELISHSREGFDAGGNLQIHEHSVLIKADTPRAVNGGGVRNAIKRYMRSNSSHHYDLVRIRYEDAFGSVRTTSLPTNDLEAAFTRREVISLSEDVEDRQQDFNKNILVAMAKLVV